MCAGFIEIGHFPLRDISNGAEEILLNQDSIVQTISSLTKVSRFEQTNKDYPLTVG